MIKITEHSGYKDHEGVELTEEHSEILQQQSYSQFFERKDDQQLCYSIKHLEQKRYVIESSYIIGVNWIVENKLPIYIEPKINKNDKEIDYLKMLFEALQEPENFNHLDGLYTINFKAPLVDIEQYQDKLTPLLLLEFLQLLKQIVRRGLKKSYYIVTHNLNSKVKGKILINATVKQNHAKQKMLYNVCQYEEFGFNSVENRILKKALLFTQSALSNLRGVNDVNFNYLFNYVSPAFQQVDENVDVKELKKSKPNPLFKEYTQALKVAKLILEKYGYNISKTTKNKVSTPPFWIDMSKLFELYVFKKLREEFTERKEIIYHKKFHGLEPDYLLKSKSRGMQMIIDAKYKPKYKKNNIGLDDARQLSGYSRLKSIYKELSLEKDNGIIDCLIVYSDQSLDEKPFRESLLNKVEDDKYLQLFKVGIRLPEI